MYRKPSKVRTSVKRNTSREGESIERMVERLLNNNETDLLVKEAIYNRPELGVVYGTDIRNDKFEKALENTQKVTEYIRSKREEKYSKKAEETAKESTQAIDAKAEGKTAE